MQKFSPQPHSPPRSSQLSSSRISAAQNLPAGTREADSPSPQDATNTQIRSAESALESGDYVAAITALKPLAAAQPKNAHILYDLGFAQEHTGDDTAAAASYKASIAADPSLAEAAARPRPPRRPQRPPRRRAPRATRPPATSPTPIQPSAPAPCAPSPSSTSTPTPTPPATSSSPPSSSPPRLRPTSSSAPASPSTPTPSPRPKPPIAASSPSPPTTPTPPPASPTPSPRRARRRDRRGRLLTSALKTTPADPRLLSQLAAVYGAEGKADQAIPHDRAAPHFGLSGRREPGDHPPAGSPVLARRATTPRLSRSFRTSRRSQSQGSRPCSTTSRAPSSNSKTSPRRRPC